MKRKSETEQDAYGSRHHVLSAPQLAALERLRVIVNERWPLNAGKLDRDALHDRDALRREFLKDAEQRCAAHPTSSACRTSR